MLAIATMILGMASCKKENKNASSLRFTASMEGFAKTVLNGETLTWNGTENITVSNTVNNVVYRATYTATPQTSNARVATFTYYSGELGESEGITYRAFYPANITTDGITVKLPTVQQSQSGELSGYPMYTESTTERLAFKNLCSVLKLTLQEPQQSVSKIQIITDKLVNGTFTVDYNDGDPILAPTNDEDHTSIITMELANPVPITDAHNFYIYLPKNTYSYMQIKVYNPDGLLFTKSTNIATTFNRSEYNYVSFNDNDIVFDAGVLNGKFTINADGKKVVFAKSYLFKYTSGENAGNYRFGGFQYSNNVLNCTFQLDHATAKLASYNIVNGGGSDRWFNMTEAEWEYLFNTRNTTFRASNNNCIRWRHVKITTHYTPSTKIGGLILFPDDFHWPLDQSRLPNNMITGSDAASAWNSIELSNQEWKVLEDAGCVFLPWTGRIERNYNTDPTTTVSNQNDGYIWTKDTEASTGKGRAIRFTSTTLRIGSYKQYDFIAIRLAKTAPLQQQEEE